MSNNDRQKNHSNGGFETGKFSDDSDDHNSICRTSRVGPVCRVQASKNDESLHHRRDDGFSRSNFKKGIFKKSGIETKREQNHDANVSRLEN